MAGQRGLSNPTDLEALKAYLIQADTKSELAPLGLRRLSIGPKAHLSVAEVAVSIVASDQAGRRARVIILKDPTPILRAGENLTVAVRAQLEPHFEVTLTVLDDGHSTLHADDEILDRAATAVGASKADLVVTVGSGTITDIGKVACARNGGLPQIAVQTAASVDGFTDNVSVVLKQGVKRTIPSRWPAAVLADTTTIGEAPPEMNVAGFGEAMSLFCAPADWYLAALLGLDDTYHPAAREIIASVSAPPTDWAGGVATGTPEAIAAQTQLLATRGMIVGLTRTTACFSGVEHVISHMLDMYQAAHGHPIGLHGAQVGVGSIVGGALWQRAVAGGEVTEDRLRLPDFDAAEARVRGAFAHLSEAIAEECWHDYKAKLEKIADKWDTVRGVVASWAEHAGDLAPLILPGDEMSAALRSAGAPTTCAELDPSFDTATVRWAVENCHLMRSRFTLVDLMDLLGLWDEATVNDLVGLIDGSNRTLPVQRTG